MTESLPVPNQLSVQLEKCKQVHPNDYHVSRTKTPKVILHFCLFFCHPVMWRFALIGERLSYWISNLVDIDLPPGLLPHRRNCGNNYFSPSVTVLRSTMYDSSQRYHMDISRARTVNKIKYYYAHHYAILHHPSSFSFDYILKCFLSYLVTRHGANIRTIDA